MEGRGWSQPRSFPLSKTQTGQKFGTEQMAPPQLFQPEQPGDKEFGIRIFPVYVNFSCSFSRRRLRGKYSFKENENRLLLDPISRETTDMDYYRWNSGFRFARYKQNQLRSFDLQEENFGKLNKKTIIADQRIMGHPVFQNRHDEPLIRTNTHSGTGTLQDTTVFLNTILKRNFQQQSMFNSK